MNNNSIFSLSSLNCMSNEENIQSSINNLDTSIIYDENIDNIDNKNNIYDINDINDSLDTSMIVEEDEVMLLRSFLGNSLGTQEKIINISTPLSDITEPSIDFCNSLITTVNHTNFPRGCRSMEIGDEDFTNLSNPLVPTFVALISAYGAGLYTTWYVFKNVKNKIYFIFRTYDTQHNIFNWSCQETNIDEIRRWSYR